MKVDLDYNGVEKIETIEEYSDLKSKYLLNISGGFEGESSISTTQYQYNGKINLNFAYAQTNNVKKTK